MSPSLPIGVDIEPTNRCNAKCWFCPRDATPHQGLMSTETFDVALRRAVELRDTLGAGLADPPEVRIGLCGLGEPLIHPRTPEWVGAVHDAGFECAMSSNGALLDERRASAVLDAGLKVININVGEEGPDYEAVYKLPFQRTLENVTRFVQMAEGRCEVRVVLVDHRADKSHIKRMRRFWRERGVTQFLPFDVVNRAGALFVDDMQFEAYPELAQARELLAEKGVNEAICYVPFAYLFVGYDGNYYLCCSDWKKEVPLGNVADTSFLGVTTQKLAAVASREPICKTCNCDPTNRLVEHLRADGAEAASTRAFVDELVTGDRSIRGLLDDLAPLVAAASPPPGPTGGKRIPVTAG